MDELERLVIEEAESVEVPSDVKAQIRSAVADVATPTTEFGRRRAARDAGFRRGQTTRFAALSAAAVIVAAALFGVGSFFTPDPETGSEVATDLAGPVAPEFAAGTTSSKGADGGGLALTDEAMGAPEAADSLQSRQSMPVEPPIGGGSGSVPGVPAQVIRTADIGVEVSDFDDAWAEAAAIPKRFGGFVESSTVSSVTGERTSSGTLTARVPADRLDDAIADFSELGEVRRQNTSTVDVAGELIDIDARLRSARTEEEALNGLLARASGIDDVLRVREQLNMIRYEIESLEGRKAALGNQVQYSTVSVSLFEDESSIDPDTDPGNFDQALKRAMSVALTVVYGALMVLAVLIPLALIAGAIWLIVRLFRR